MAHKYGRDANVVETTIHADGQLVVHERFGCGQCGDFHPMSMFPGCPYPPPSADLSVRARILIASIGIAMWFGIMSKLGWGG